MLASRFLCVRALCPLCHIPRRVARHPARGAVLADQVGAARQKAFLKKMGFLDPVATELVRRRVRESTVQTILGHASPQTTRIYVHKSAVEVADEYQDAFGDYRPPRASGE